MIIFKCGHYKLPVRLRVYWNHRKFSPERTSRWYLKKKMELNQLFRALQSIILAIDRLLRTQEEFSIPLTIHSRRPRTKEDNNHNSNNNDYCNNHHIFFKFLKEEPKNRVGLSETQNVRKWSSELETRVGKNRDTISKKLEKVQPLQYDHWNLHIQVLNHLYNTGLISSRTLRRRILKDLENLHNATIDLQVSVDSH